MGQYVRGVSRAGRTLAGFAIGKGLNRSFNRAAISGIAAHETVFGDCPQSRLKSFHATAHSDMVLRAAGWHRPETNFYELGPSLRASLRIPDVDFESCTLRFGFHPYVCKPNFRVRGSGGGPAGG